MNLFFFFTRVILNRGLCKISIGTFLMKKIAAKIFLKNLIFGEDLLTKLVHSLIITQFRSQDRNVVVTGELGRAR